MPGLRSNAMFFFGQNVLDVQAMRIVAHQLTYPPFFSGESLLISTSFLDDRNGYVVNLVPVFHEVCCNRLLKVLVTDSEAVTGHALVQGQFGLTDIDMTTAEGDYINNVR